MLKNISNWAKRNGENILDVAASLPGASTAVNVVRVAVLKKEPMARVSDPIVDSMDETNATEEGKVNRTKSAMLIAFGAMILNALAAQYLGVSIPVSLIMDFLTSLV